MHTQSPKVLLNETTRHKTIRTSLFTIDVSYQSVSCKTVTSPLEKRYNLCVFQSKFTIPRSKMDGFKSDLFKTQLFGTTQSRRANRLYKVVPVSRFPVPN